jgi:hypothetical protein
MELAPWDDDEQSPPTRIKIWLLFKAASNSPLANFVFVQPTTYTVF